MDKLSKIKHVFSGTALKAVLRWSKPVRGSVLLISLIGVTGSLLSLGVTLVTKNLVDGATSANESALWRWGIALVALIVTERLLSVANSAINVRASARFQAEMQRMVTASVIGKEYAYLKPFHSGELLNRVSSDVGVVKNGIMGLLPSLLKMLVSFVGAAIILITMDWRFVPVIIIASCVGMLIAVLFRDPMKRRHKRVQEAQGALRSSTQETFENIRIVKASVSEERAMRQIEGDRTRLVNEQLRNGRLSILMNQGMGSIFDISWLVCQIWGCVKIYRGTFTYGSLAALIQLVGRIQAPIANAVNLVSQAYGVVASAERLQEIIDLPDEATGVELETFDEINLEHVFFQYDESSDDVLSDIDDCIKRGDFVALTGISGGGKTSLFQLLLGIYRPTSGNVSFISGGHAVPASKGTRRLFSYVPQGNTLMSGTLRENIESFTDNPSEEMMVKAIQAACLDDVVAEVGLDARLGERGIGLSEGQAQRVAIARALLSDSPILLLDEATSALDEQTEARLLKNIAGMRDKTVIIVTHRRAALAICDYQLHIENGRMTRIEGTAQ
ncbi:MAG: ABC transporter ATP-binding protein/permease [Clostridiales bacterium]|nr:ABC transporter ATP-binding protein/permease [Clostridiales bacterium]